MPIPADSVDDRRYNNRAAWRHAIPFIAWIALMFGLKYVGEPAAWKYAVRAATALILLVACRPWKWYEPLRLRNVPASVIVGIAVCAVWVLPEVKWGDSYPFVQELYLRFGILPLGKIPTAAPPFIYAPATCGWPLTLVRLAGSAFVIAVIEEFFWRGFLYRWVMDRRFLQVKLSEFDWEAFIIVCAVFGLEHNRWLAGVVAGAAYALLMIRTRDIWAACLAHVVTNLLLGIYVLATASYVFW